MFFNCIENSSDVPKILQLYREFFNSNLMTNFPSRQMAVANPGINLRITLLQPMVEVVVDGVRVHKMAALRVHEMDPVVGQGMVTQVDQMVLVVSSIDHVSILDTKMAGLETLLVKNTHS